MVSGAIEGRVPSSVGNLLLLRLIALLDALYGIAAIMDSGLPDTVPRTLTC